MNKRVKEVAQKLVRKNLTLSLAESCTGGLVSSALTSFSGASKFYLGSVVAYANEAKHDLLGVSSGVIKARGAVSKEVALGMARGARKKFRSDWSVSITGIAGPTGGSKLKPVGLVFFAVAGPKIEVTQKRIFKGSRNEIQKAAAQEALSLLLKKLK